VRWIAGGDETHFGETERATHVVGKAQMPVVNRVEGAA
jgi:hypothetical protein